METEAELRKPPLFVAFRVFLGCHVRPLDCLAGDAVLIAPVSKQIPWYQGILQGILTFWGLETRSSTKKRLRCSHMSNNSLSKLARSAPAQLAQPMQRERGCELRRSASQSPRA